MPPLACLFIPASQQIPIAPHQLAAFQQLTAMDSSKKRRRATVSSSECSPDDDDDSLHSVILEVLKHSSGIRGMPKKKLKKAVKKQASEFSKKEFKRALKELVKNGKVLCSKDEKTKSYRLVEVESDEDSVSSSGDSDSSKNSMALSNDDAPAAVPIAMRLRGESIDETKEKKKVMFQEDKPEDLDDEIARLERELANDNSDEESEDEEDDSSQQSNEEGQPAVLSLSKFSDDRVESLPTVALPEPGRYDANGMPIRKKKKRKIDKEKSDSNATIKKPSGLEQAVKEVLSGYQARSSERLPFYCRFCAKQYDNETDFFAHKSQDFHKTAVEAERKATYCKLCRVQLTSPVQMKEHLKSRPHKERLQSMRNKQQGGGRGPGMHHNTRPGPHHGPGRHAGRGGGRYAGDRGRVSRV